MFKKHSQALIALFVLCAASRAYADPAAEASDFSQDPRMGEIQMQRGWSVISERLEQRKVRKVDEVALATATEWRDGEGATPPTQGENGRVVFAYGAVLPKISCALLRLCDIELQAGEMIPEGGVHLGDTVRWDVMPAFSGTTSHVIIKPKQANIQTNLAIYTNRRVYHIELEATLDQSIPFASFTYPDDTRRAWREYLSATQQPEPRREDSPHESGRSHLSDSDYVITANPGALRFGYSVEKEGECKAFFLKRWFSKNARRRCSWAPTRVYDDGEKTIIEMPRSMLAREAPVMFVREGGEDVIVNYRLKGQHFVVDRLFAEAVLVKGVGRKQERVVLRQPAED